MITGQRIAEKALEIAHLNPKGGYIYGTSGQLWTVADQARITTEKAGNPDYEYSIKYGGQWVGHKVWDCSGLTKYVYAEFGVNLAHGSNSQYRACKTTGPAMEAPVGALVFKRRNGTDYHHVGIHAGNGQVVEAQGARTGVIISDLAAWYDYGLIAGIDYSGTGTAQIPSPDPEPSPDPGPDMDPMVGALQIMHVRTPNHGTVNLRSAPDGRQIGTLREGQMVQVTAVSGKWAACEIKGTYWIDTTFLRED